MPAVRLFNPENDVALAYGSDHFTPPAPALKIARAGCCMPLWWSEPEDMLILPSGIDTAVVNRFITENNLPGKLYRHGAHGAPEPWGWSRYARQRYKSAGFPDDKLPDGATLDKLRMVSHRRTSIALFNIIREQIPEYPLHQAPAEIRTVDTVPEQCFLKQPWSSSGRGVFDSRLISRDKLLRIAGDSIRRQGSVMAEPCLDKRLDFAMLFRCNAGSVSYRGLSVFHTASGSEYAGNIMAPQSKLQQFIAHAVDGGAKTLSEIRNAVNNALNLIIPSFYSGWAGVDMMVYRDNNSGKMLIAPAVELNMRITMGVTALLLEKHEIFHGKEGLLKIIPSGSFNPGRHKLLSPVIGDGPCYIVEFTQHIV